MSIENDFNEILDYAHMWNWAPDWAIVREIYSQIPDSYSVLTPFAYSYLEEMIRSTTSEYGIIVYDKDKKPNNHRKVGAKLIDLAIKENSDKPEYVQLLDQAKRYFQVSDPHDGGDNRDNVNHGYLHPRYWSKESFENLIHFIAELSKYSQF